MGSETQVTLHVDHPVIANHLYEIKFSAGKLAIIQEHYVAIGSKHYSYLGFLRITLLKYACHPPNIPMLQRADLLTHLVEEANW